MARLYNELLRHLPDRAGRASRTWYLQRAARGVAAGVPARVLHLR